MRGDLEMFNDLLEDGPPMSDGRGRGEGEVMNERDGTQDEVTDGVTSVTNESDETQDVVMDEVTSGVTDVRKG